LITDSHAHVFWSSFDEDREQVLERARAAGVSRMVVVGTNLATSRAAFELCRPRTGLFPSAGIHPHDCAEAGESDHAGIAALARDPACVAVGETGLDHFKEFSPRARQAESFRWHLRLARELDKPVIVHCRDAHGPTVGLLREFPGVRGVMHCYTMGPGELAPYLEAGFHISFSGVVTYPRNDANRAAAREVPLDRLLVETDCPYLAPQGQRGRRNEPALVRGVLEVLAAERGATFEDLARATARNAARLFGLDRAEEARGK
jgi:TatD DNase family protein